ncbi:MAG: winged helix-turn-helix transcriptional regulator [Acidimicrobiales bacterium]
MSASRTYGDPCGVARSLDVVGERWALLVVRELLLGPKRFSDLLDGLAGASPNVVSQRLRDLVQYGVVRRRNLGPPTRIHLYELTDWGRELEPAILHLGRWGSQAPLPERGTLGIDSLVLSLKAASDTSRTQGEAATYELHIDDHVFVLELSDRALSARHGTAQDPDATITTSRETLTALVQGKRTLDDVLRTTDLKVEGDKKASALAMASLLTSATSGT